MILYSKEISDHDHLRCALNRYLKKFSPLEILPHLADQILGRLMPNRVYGFVVQRHHRVPGLVVQDGDLVLVIE